MANLIRLCAGYNVLTLKSLTNWKLCSNSFQILATKHRFSNTWRHFTTRNVISNTKEPLSFFEKLCLGITAGTIIKLVGSNVAFMFTNAVNETKLDSTNNNGFLENPEFNWKKFFQLLQPYWAELLGAILAAVVCALLNIQIPRALGCVVDVLTKISGFSETIFSDLKMPAIKMITYYSLQSLCTFVYIALLAHVGEGVAKTMKMNLFSSVLDQDIAFFDRNRSGEILNRLTVDVQEFKSSFKMIISQGLRNITQIIGCSFSLFYISPLMTGLMMIIVPTAIGIGTFIGTYLREISYNAKSQAAKVTLTAEEAVSNIRTVRSFAMEELEKRVVNEEAELCKYLNIKLGYGIALFQAGTNLFLNGMVLGTIYLGGYMMTTGNITAGDLMAFLVAVQLLQRSFSQISLLFGIYIRGKHAGARVFEMIDLPYGRTLKGAEIIPYHSLIPNVQFKDVVFSYPTRPDMNVLNKINLTIPEGKTVAIVGSSGSGKSTLAWLLERFYDVNEGSILLDGKDIRILNSKWLRKNVIGFISQEPVLFATTVLENIRYGKPNATDAEVIEAAKLANADEFIREFPEGYNTVVGERGVSVSGGQKQRIAIARALIKNPSILILDEATSALDSESEKAVQKALDQVIKSRTTIIIAHRLSTIRNADLIVVLHNGVIVESGTHKELLEKQGMYAALVAQQMEDVRAATDAVNSFVQKAGETVFVFVVLEEVLIVRGDAFKNFLAS